MMLVYLILIGLQIWLTNVVWRAKEMMEAEKLNERGQNPAVVYATSNASAIYPA